MKLGALAIPMGSGAVTSSIRQLELARDRFRCPRVMAVPAAGRGTSAAVFGSGTCATPTTAPSLFFPETGTSRN